MGKTVALILAAGQGTRFGGDTPKQFLKLSGKPLWQRSLEAFMPFSDEIYVVTDKTHSDQIAETLLEWISAPSWNAEGKKPYLFVTTGGESRAESVLSGLRYVKEISEREPDRALPEVVLIHDAARCLVTAEIISACLTEARRSGAAIAAVPMTDTVKTAVLPTAETVKTAAALPAGSAEEAPQERVGGTSFPTILDTPDRRTLYKAQTPQGFSYKLILEAYEEAENAGALHALTDDASAVERFAEHRISLTPGSSENLKITDPTDLAFAEMILRIRQRRKLFTERKKSLPPGKTLRK